MGVRQRSKNRLDGSYLGRGKYYHREQRRLNCFSFPQVFSNSYRIPSHCTVYSDISLPKGCRNPRPNCKADLSKKHKMQILQIHIVRQCDVIINLPRKEIKGRELEKKTGLGRVNSRFSYIHILLCVAFTGLRVPHVMSIHATFDSSAVS